MSDIDVVVWLTYFGAGVGLLSVLVLARKAQKLRAARKNSVTRAVARMNYTKKSEESIAWEEQGARSIR